MNYIRFLWDKKYVGLLIVLVCACLGSVRGAWKESGEPFIGVTEMDLADMENAGAGAPEMTGVIALAAEQNRWLNFDYAFHYAGRGVVCYCVLAAAYMPLHQRYFKSAQQSSYEKRKKNT